MVFKNRYIETKEMNRIRCGVSEGGIVLVFFYVLLMFTAWMSSTYWLTAVWGLLAIITLFSAHDSIQKWEKRYEEKPVKDPEMLLEFYDDKLVVTENKNEPRELLYSDIQDIEEREGAFVLFFDFKEKDKYKFSIHIMTEAELEETTLLVLKSGFEHGDVKDFKKFIKSRKQKGFVIH